MIDAHAEAPPRREQFRRGSRRVTLKRSPTFRGMTADDLKYLGAAWRRGALDQMGGPFADHELSAQEFMARAAEALARIDALWILEAPVGGKSTPVGLVAAAVVEHRLEPHVYWFPWSSLRNRLEAAVKFLNTARREFLVVIVHRMRDKRFFEAVAAHGIMKRAGTIPGYYADDGALIWWAPKPGGK